MIDESVVADVLNTALSSGAEFAEVFAEDKRGTGAALDDGRIENVASGHDRGAGVRVVVGETAGYAHTADLSPESLAAAARAAAAVARDGGGGARTVDLSPTTHPNPSTIKVAPDTIEKARKIELLRLANDSARSAGDAVKQVMASYGDSRRQILVANTDGVFTSDTQIRTRFMVQVIAAGDTGMQVGYRSVGSTAGFELFDEVSVADKARQAAASAITKLSARPAPSGTMPVVIAPGTGGVMFHEACGHGLEADAIAKEASVFAGKVGQQVACRGLTLVDDGTMAGQWGAFAIDDEGHPAGRNTLIDDGILTDYMWDWLRARKQGRPQSGNGRRESYQHLPMVRMTNTYVLAGDGDPAEILAQTPTGVYIQQLGGGQVDPASGDFVFGMAEAFLIEDGQITDPIRDGNLIGNGPASLQAIDAIGNDFDMGSPGTCGKNGQGVPVGDGNPTIRVAAMTVGGTAA